MNIVGAVILGIITIALIILSNTYLRKKCTPNFYCGVFLGMILAALIIVETALVAGIIYGPRPSAIDVYRGNTELEIISVNGMPIDTIVVFKKDLK